MNLLGLDTSTEVCSVALQSGGEMIYRKKRTAREHTRLLLPWVAELLAEAQSSVGALDGIVLTRGPGSFTGIRIGLAAGQGLALAADIPILPLSTLMTMVHGAQDHFQLTEAHVAVALDARMGQVYAASYEIAPGAIRLVDPECVADPNPDTVFHGAIEPGIDLGIGPGFAAYPALGQDIPRVVPDWLPDARSMLAIAMRAEKSEWCAPELVEPTYLRNQVTQAPSIKSA